MLLGLPFADFRDMEVCVIVVHNLIFHTIYGRNRWRPVRNRFVLISNLERNKVRNKAALSHPQ